MNAIINLIKNIVITCPECSQKMLLKNCENNEEKLMRDLVNFWGEYDYSKQRSEEKYKYRKEQEIKGRIDDSGSWLFEKDE